MPLWSAASSRRLSAQTAWMPAGGTSGLLRAPEPVLRRLPQTHDTGLGAVPGLAGLSGHHPGAAIEPYPRLQHRGTAECQLDHPQALATLVGRYHSFDQFRRGRYLADSGIGEPSDGKRPTPPEDSARGPGRGGSEFQVAPDGGSDLRRPSESPPRQNHPCGAPKTPARSVATRVAAQAIC